MIGSQQTTGILRGSFTVQPSIHGAPLVSAALQSDDPLVHVSKPLKVLRQVPHGELQNRAEFREKYGHLLSPARRALGAVQMPFLRDPNTGTELLESADIVKYLYKTYRDGPMLEETWLDFNSAAKTD